MTARRVHRCTLCGRQRGYSHDLCSTCRRTFAPVILASARAAS